MEDCEKKLRKKWLIFQYFIDVTNVIEYCSTKPNYNESTFELMKTPPALQLK